MMTLIYVFAAVAVVLIAFYLFNSVTLDAQFLGARFHLETKGKTRARKPDEV